MGLNYPVEPSITPRVLKRPLDFANKLVNKEENDIKFMEGKKRGGGGGGRGRGGAGGGGWDWLLRSAAYGMTGQWGPAAWHRDPYPICCDHLYGKTSEEEGIYVYA